MTQPTISEVVEALRSPDVRVCLNMADRIQAHGIAPPDGYVIVPIEPTKEMIHEVEHATRLGAVWTAYAVYKAMLTAAPKQEVKP